MSLWAKCKGVVRENRSKRSLDFKVNPYSKRNWLTRQNINSPCGCKTHSWDVQEKQTCSLQFQPVQDTEF